MLQLAIERVREFGLENIYISTNENYVPLVQEQVAELFPDHILSEPARRDLAAAVGLTLMRLKKRGVSGTVAILWSDHFMERSEEFVKALRDGEKLIQEDPNRFVFLGEEPRFANHNLGWVQIGKNIKDNQFEFLGWKYRPELALCERMYASGVWLWNPGYFIFNIDFVLGLYKEFMPSMSETLKDMVETDEKLRNDYNKLEAISFDNAIIEKIYPAQAVVLKVNLGWSDPGTLYALKEALTLTSEENFVKGSVLAHESVDCFLLNEEDGKLLTAVGLDGVVVVNTKDAVLVCHKDKVPEIKGLLKKIEEQGLESYL